MGSGAKRSQLQSWYHGKPKPFTSQNDGEAKTKSLGKEAVLQEESRNV